MGYYGEDGQLYDTLDQLRGANNRYRQQQEHNRLLKEQNDFLQKEKERREREKQAQSDKERRDSILKGLTDFISLFKYGLGEDIIDDFSIFRQIIFIKVEMMESILKSDIDYLNDIRKNITTTDNSDIDKFFNEGFNDLFKETEVIFLVKMDMLKSYIDKRKSENISFGNEIFDNMYNNVLNYGNTEFSKNDYTSDFIFDENKCKHWRGYFDLFRKYKKSILENVEIEKNCY